MHDRQLAAHFSSPGGRRNVYFFNVNIAGSFNPAKGRARQLGLLEEHHRLTVGNPGLDAAVAQNCVGLAGHDVEELVVG